MSRPVKDGARFDIAIVGGGLVGATLAHALSSQGWRVALVEAVAPRAEMQPSYDDRTLALSDSSCRIRAGLGIWPTLQDNATPIHRVIVRELEGPGRVELDPSDHGLEQFGHVVEARAFGAAMMKLLAGLATLELIMPAQVQGMRTGEEGVGLRFEFGGKRREIEASLVVGADGAASFVRQAAGIAAREHEYGQTALVCNFTPAEPHEGRAFECFGASGPLAILPHQGQRCGLVWCLPEKEASNAMEMPEPEFLAAAQARFGDELGAFQRLGRRSSYPLRQVVSLGDTARRTVILGYAAHAIHPIGAQGFKLGLRDVAVLAELLAEFKRAGRDPGEASLLNRYHQWRAHDQAETAGWSDFLARIYANPGLGARLARSAGLIAHRLLPSLRRRTAARAMGYRGRIPRLALGEPLQ
jgi:2-octaprenyl-6-methoxyphenol hydroxylase